MDMYLTAAADALVRRSMGRNDLASLPDEDAYYARATWNFPAWSFAVPAWVSRMLALVRNGRSKTPQRVPAARHA